MTFVCSIRYNNGSVKYKNITADSEIDACWLAKDYAKSQSAELVNVSHARTNNRSKTSVR